MRVLAVSDDLPFLGRLSALLSQQPGLEVVGRAISGWEGLKLAAQLDCHLVVTDGTLPDMSGAAMALSLKKGMRPPLVVILSRHAATEYFKLAANAGADGFLLKDDIANLPSLLQRIDPANSTITGGHGPTTLFGHKRKPLLKNRTQLREPRDIRRPDSRKPEDTG